MNRRICQPPGGDCHDVFGFDFNGSPNPSHTHHRITKPPGGDTNEIFTTPNSTPPSTPRKVKNYMASNIFTPEVQGGMSNEPRNIRHRPDDDSFRRLFGAQGGIGGDVTDSPRNGKNHQKSSIIFADAGVANGKANGHHANGTSNGHSTNGTNGTNGVSTNGTNGVSTNGTTNGHGGHSENGSGSSTPNGNPSNGVAINGNGVNGSTSHAKTNGTNGTHETPTKRIPPGGFSSKLW